MAKRRLYELAKERGLESSELLEALASAGVEGKSALSTMEEAELDEILKDANGAASGKASAAAAPSANGAGPAGASAGPLRGSGQPTRCWMWPVAPALLPAPSLQWLIR